MAEVGAYFPAKWKGYCSFCSEQWEPGDTIGYVSDDLVCEECRSNTIEANEFVRLLEAED